MRDQTPVRSPQEPIDPSLRARTLERLEDLRSDGLARWLAPPTGIDLSSNDYLGMANDEHLKCSAVRAMYEHSVGSTGSRLLRGHRELFSEVERDFASWKGTDRSLFFGSGYLANLGTLQAFIENSDLIFSDEFNHASLIDGCRMTKTKRVIFKHRDVDQVASYLRNTSGGRQKFLVTESLFSMDGTIAPLDRYAEICAETNTALIVDEAHAVGIYGHQGSGLIEEFGIADHVFLSVNTAGKALGVSGAFVAGEDWAIEYLLQKARTFIFSTAPPPVVPAALIESIKFVRKEALRRERLWNLSRYFRSLIAEIGFNVPSSYLMDRSPIIAIHIGDNERAVAIAKELQSRGYDVRAIRPPTVAEGTARLRISINISLTRQILEDFARELRNVVLKF